MLVFRGFTRKAPSATVLTIGNFDGVHLGHRALLAQLRATAAREGLLPAALTFEPHPREFFGHESAPARLSTLREKLEMLAEEGAALAYVCHFNARFAALSAEEFIERLDLLRQHFIDALVIRQTRQFLHSAGIRYVDALAHIVEDGEGEVRLAAFAAHMTGGFVEGGAFHDQLAIQPIRQVGFDPLADEAVRDGFEGAAQRTSIDLEATDAIELGRG